MRPFVLASNEDTHHQPLLFSAIMSWFFNPEGIAKKKDEVDPLVPDPTNPSVMVSNKR